MTPSNVIEANAKLQLRKEMMEAVGRFHSTDFTIVARYLSPEPTTLPESRHFPELVKDYLRTYYRDRIEALNIELTALGVDLK